MNRWVADVFASIIAFVHSVVLIALVGVAALLYGDQKTTMPPILGYSFSKEIMLFILVGAFLGYVLLMGFISTVIAMNQNIERLTAAVEKLKDGG